jgi:uncharacterized protein YchJ
MTKLSPLLFIVVLLSCFLLFLFADVYHDFDSMIVGGAEAFAAANKKKGNNNSKLKKKKTGGSGSSSFGGFGTPPEPYNDVIKGFKTRLPDNNDEGDGDVNSKLRVPCPCNGGNGGTGTDNDNNNDDENKNKKISKTFNECCGPLIASTAAASSSQDESESTITGGCLTPRQVLQSRYAAFYYRDVNHIIQTTHEVCRDYQDNKLIWAKELDKNGMFDSFEFVGLNIINEEIVENEAYLEFTVRLRGRTYEDSSKRTEQSSLSSIEGEETVVSEKSKFIKDSTTGIWKYAGGDVRSNVKGLDDITLNA